MNPLPEAVANFVNAAPVCRIATVRQNGHAHIIPVCPAFDGQRTVFVDIASKGVTARALVGNDHVTVLIDQYFDDWSKLAAVILYCRAERLLGQELDQAWQLFRAKFPQGEAMGWSSRLTIALRIESWIQWGVTGPLEYDPE